jgi:hypothetical protein
MTTNEIPATTNLRTRAIERALNATGTAFIWMGGRTRVGYTEHGAFGDGQGVRDAVAALGWEGVTVIDAGIQRNRSRGEDVHVYWIRVPKA